MTNISEDIPTQDQADKLIEIVKRLNTSMEASNLSIEDSNRAITKSNERIAQLGEASERNRNFIWLLFVMGCLGALFSLFSGFAIYKANEARNDAHDAINSNRELAIVSCKETNEVRALQLTLWSRKLAKELEIETDPVQKAAAQEMLIFVTETFVPRDCPELLD